MSRVDVTVVAYGSLEVIGDAVANARAIGGGARVVVVDHGVDGSAEVAARAGATVLVDRSNPGFGSGQNRAVAATSAPYVLLLNPDARVEPGAVERGADYLDSHPGVGAVQGVVSNSPSGLPERSQGIAIRPVHLWGRALGARRLLARGPVRRMARHIRLLSDHVDREPEVPMDVESLAATALLVRRVAFDDVGGFDPGYFLYGEDLDLCHRLRARGWRLIALPEHWATHLGGASSAGWATRELVWWEGTMRYAARWWSFGAFAASLAAVLIRWLTLAVCHPGLAVESFRRIVVAPVNARRSR